MTTLSPLRQLHMPPVSSGEHRASALGGVAMLKVKSALAGSATGWKEVFCAVGQPRSSLRMRSTMGAAVAASTCVPPSTRST